MATIVRTEKRCSRCGRVLPVAEFNISRARIDGLQSYCKACAGEYYAAYRKTHRPPLVRGEGYIPMKDRTPEERAEHRREVYRRYIRTICSSPTLYARYLKRCREYARRRRARLRQQAEGQ